MREFLKGKKTYIIAGLMFARAVFELVIGDITIGQFIEGPYITEALLALGLSSTRAGIDKVGS